MDEIIKEIQNVNKEIQIVDNRISQAIANEKTRLDSLKERDAHLREKLLEAMELSIANGGSKKFENDVLRITYVPAQIRTTFDSTRFKNEAPEIYSEFTKETEVKPHLKISVYETD